MEHTRIFEDLFRDYPALAVVSDSLNQAFAALVDTFNRGGKVLLCGNGGSAADCEHIAAELLKGFVLERSLDGAQVALLGPEMAQGLENGFPVIPLTGFDAFQTAYANDDNAAFAFAQLVWCLGRPGDLLWGLSTSGNSANVIHAFRVARSQGMSTLALTGESGGSLREFADVCVRVPSDFTPRIQEYHLPLYHALCLALEWRFFGGGQ